MLGDHLEVRSEAHVGAEMGDLELGLRRPLRHSPLTKLGVGAGADQLQRRRSQPSRAALSLVLEVVLGEGAVELRDELAAPVGAPAFVTQNGSTLNLVNEAGQSSRAWPDMFTPNSRIWADNWNTSAVYSPDGMLIQFDNGTVWQRDMGPPPPPVRVRYRAAAVVR